MMLDLDDPLWRKLNHASWHEFDIPKLLSGLAETWDADQASDLLNDCLLSDMTCRSATYAAVPHLLKIAEPEVNQHQRREIALFLGFVAQGAFSHEHQMDKDKQAPLDGLPEAHAGVAFSCLDSRSSAQCMRARPMAASRNNPERRVPMREPP